MSRQVVESRGRGHHLGGIVGVDVAVRTRVSRLPKAVDPGAVEPLLNKARSAVGEQ